MKAESLAMDAPAPASPAVMRSIFAPVSLAAEVAQAYAIGRPVTCRLLKPGLNDTYLLTGADARYILRVYRAGWRSPSDVRYELELLAHLAAKGVPVSWPVAATNGAVMRTVTAPEGPRELVLFTYAEGGSLSWDDAEQCRTAGQLLARLHAASDDFVSRHARFRLDLNYLIEKPLAAIRPLLLHRPDDLSYLARLADNLRARVDAAASAGLDWGVCHGDIGKGNLHVAGDGAVTVFDFDFSGPGWRAYDVAVAQLHGMVHPGANMEAFAQGYAETRSLAPHDLAAVPVFHGIRRLWSAGVSAENVAEAGSLRLSETHLDWVLTSLREWEMHYRALELKQAR